MKYKIQITDEAGNFIKDYTLTRNPSSEEKTLDDFILEALQISENKRQLPLKIQCPNELEVYPSIKMQLEDCGNPFFGSKLRVMFITWGKNFKLK